MGLWLPPRVGRELLDARYQHAAEVMEQARTDATVHYWTRELKRIDERLRMIRALLTATVPGLKPGYYHILRDNPDAPVSLIPVEGPDGEFREPDSGIFDLLRRNDLWNAEAQRDRDRMRHDAERARNKRRETEREARRQEIRERVRALRETSISMTDARPWTQVAGARHGRTD